jgi:hypothetical protein
MSTLLMNTTIRSTPHLTSEQDVLLRLMLRSLASVHQEDGAVHLGGTRDHVLDVVGVPRAVDVSVVTGGRLVLDVRDSDRHCLGLIPNRSTFGDVGVALELGEPSVSLNGQEGCGQRSLAVVDVTDGSHIHVNLHGRDSGLPSPLSTRSPVCPTGPSGSRGMLNRF